MLWQTSRELVLEDDEHEPILTRMTDAPYIKALEAFETRILYSNVFYDSVVFHSTAALRTHNPYRPHSALGWSRSTAVECAITLVSLLRPVRDDTLVEVRIATTDSPHRTQQLVNMLTRLRSLTWMNFDAIIPSIRAHEQIIAKRSGHGIVMHLKAILVDGKLPAVNHVHDELKDVYMSSPYPVVRLRASRTKFAMWTVSMYVVFLLVLDAYGERFLPPIIRFGFAFIATTTVMFDNVMNVWY
jgi:hypothetical protein